MHPKTIDPCPIVESVIEIRYSSVLPNEAIFGLLYGTLELQRDFSKVEPQPILQIPEVIRNQDESLKYQPHYILTNREGLRLKIGPKSLVFGCINNYVGWSLYSDFIKKYMEKVHGNQIIDLVERIGLRYINLFPYSLLDKIKMDIVIAEDKISNNTMTLRVEKGNGHPLEVIQVANNVEVQTIGFQGVGSTIDIDCIMPLMMKYISYKDQIAPVVELLHNREKDVFYSLLKPDFLAALNPKY